MLVENLEHLKHLATNENGDFQDFYVLLAKGLAKSRKRILFFPKFDEFAVINEIDESYQEFSTSDIELKTNLILAIGAKALFKG